MYSLFVCSLQKSTLYSSLVYVLIPQFSTKNKTKTKKTHCFHPCVMFRSSSVSLLHSPMSHMLTTKMQSSGEYERSGIPHSLSKHSSCHEGTHGGANTAPTLSFTLPRLLKVSEVNGRRGHSYSSKTNHSHDWSVLSPHIMLTKILPFTNKEM